mmetsp:Transcript_41815/g.107905  ORF Transcript_41815/g.107905 Transcript_41815/m.107905 type:complete len:92 (+) Transcript_41815:202-477(+)
MFPFCAQQLGHEIKRVTATKRYWKCCHCSKNTYVFGSRAPPRICDGCGSLSFVQSSKLGRENMISADDAVPTIQTQPDGFNDNLITQGYRW